TVRELPVAEGGRIQAGDLLLRLDAPDLQAVVDRLRVERDYWEQRSAADRRLAEQNALPAEQAETSLRAFGSADAAYREALSRLEKAEDHSPVTGRVLKWLVEPGQHVMPGQPLLLIGDNAAEIRVEVIETDLQRGIREKTRVDYLDNQGVQRHAVVREVAVQAQGAARTFTLRIDPLEADMRDVRLGSAVAIDFILRQAQNILVVPVAAIADENRLFVIRDGQAREQRVRTGIEADERIEVDFDWNGQDEVAVSNLSALRDGVPVYAVPIGEVQP
ncbi:HlyD family efflux transporter periplasmic adaptor subunit, partial [candidate division KSB1 bacterium]|nr:HlyD family efflux transporter periplasmic adaptor subunit [candidate division KSB1 bacterium]